MPADQTIKLRSPGELIAAVPYLIGFHPADCYVVCGLVADSPVMHLRVDDSASSDLDDLTEMLKSHLKRGGAERSILIAHGHVASESLLPLTASLRAAGMPVLDALSVVDGRWRSLLCDSTTCCPATGNPIPQPEQLPAVAQFVAAGRVARSSRAALIADLVPDPERQERTGECMGEIRDGNASAAESLQRWRDVVESVASGACLPGPRARAQLLVSLRNVSVRDALLAEIVEGPDAFDPVLAWLASSCPQPDAAPVLTLTALPAWLRGDGARAGQVLEVALAADSGYRLAQLLDCGLRAGVPPGEIAAVCRGATGGPDVPSAAS